MGATESGPCRIMTSAASRCGVTVAVARQQAKARLRHAGIDDAAMDADLLLAHVLAVPRLTLPLHSQRGLTAAEQEQYDVLLFRRAAHEPVQYLLGVWPFCDLQLTVGPGVLIPRPETEELVDLLLRRDYAVWRAGGRPVLADIGAGSGCLGLALLAAVPSARGLLVEPHVPALAFTARNTAAQAVAARVQVVRGWGVQCLRSASFDLVAANLPYIPAAEIPGLMPEVARHEPVTALDGGADGLEPIRALLADVARVLRPDGLVAIEHGHGQRAALRATPAPGLVLLGAHDDLAGRERFMVWQRKESS